MDKQKVISTMQTAMADTYALYLKTQNYHWHVTGPHFKPLHDLFEDQYNDLFQALDDVAERIITLGGESPATFEEFQKLTNIKPGQKNLNSEAMVEDLRDDHQKVIESFRSVLHAAQEVDDEGTASLVGDRMADHEKMRWMLASSV